MLRSAHILPVLLFPLGMAAQEVCYNGVYMMGGKNDVFKPLDCTGARGTLEIYDRWGKMVLSTQALTRGRDGRAKGGPLSAGTYYYIVEPLPNGAEPSAGHFTLIR